MSKDNNSSNGQGFSWKPLYHRGKRAGGRALGALLKLLGVLAVIAGLLTIALANMDINPRESIVWGMVYLCIGLLMIHFGNKIVKKTKRV